MKTNRSIHLKINRRSFIQTSLVAGAGAASLLPGSFARGAEKGPPAVSPQLPHGKIGKLSVSRLLLGGNLLTHFTHSRDLQYVYNLAAHYNTPEKILETLALAEQHGVNTLVIHTVPETMKLLQRYRKERGGKMQYIICPTAPLEPDFTPYKRQVEELVQDGVDAIYLWGVRADDLAQQSKIDLIVKAVETAKALGVPSGVGAHDLHVITECERYQVPADFYIKTFHHHNYATAPKPQDLQRAHAEVPGYWCKDPQKTVEVMAGVTKPWIAFKVMAAGAIPPANAFKFAFKQGADHVLAGMFDFEIADDVRHAADALKSAATRARTWRS